MDTTCDVTLDPHLAHSALCANIQHLPVAREAHARPHFPLWRRQWRRNRSYEATTRWRRPSTARRAVEEAQGFAQTAAYTARTVHGRPYQRGVWLRRQQGLLRPAAAACDSYTMQDAWFRYSATRCAGAVQRAGRVMYDKLAREQSWANAVQT